MIEETSLPAVEDEEKLMVLIEDRTLVGWLRDGRILTAGDDPLDGPAFIEIPRVALPVERAARLAQAIYLQAVRDTAATFATCFLRDLAADSALEYAWKSLEILLVAETATADNVPAYAADLDSWYRLAYGCPAHEVLRYIEEPETQPLIEYRNALSMLILALQYPL